MDKQSEYISDNFLLKSSRILHNKEGTPDLLGRVKATPFASIYLKYLRSFYLFKLVDIIVWKYGGMKLLLFCYKRIKMARAKSSSLHGSSLLKYADISESDLMPQMEILEPRRIIIDRPNVISSDESTGVNHWHRESTFPAISVTEATNAIIYGGSNLSFTSSYALCHDLYNFEKDYTSEELHGRHHFVKKSNRLIVLDHDPEPFLLPSAATFLDSCAHNYAHFLTEVLPRIQLFCSLQEHQDIPLVIDDNLHENILCAIAIIVGSRRQIYFLPVSRAMQVSRLFITSATGYVPFDQRNPRTKNDREGEFSHHSFQRLRSRFSSIFTQTNKSSNHPQKIYIRRDSSHRKFLNQQKFEELLVRHGFIIIDPASLSFEEQFLLFNNAKIIVGPTGAAMANSIFCQTSAEVVIIMAEHKHMIYNYWPSMLAPLKVKVSYLLGVIISNHYRGIHGDYILPESVMREFASQYC